MKKLNNLSLARTFPLVATAAIVASLAGGLVACSSEDEPPQPEENELKVYHSEAYGYAVTFDEESREAVGYAVVDGKCWRQPVPQEVWWASTRDDTFLDFDYLGQKEPGMPFYRVDAFDDACPGGTLKTALDEDFAPDFELEYELFQRTFAEHYAFFELREVDWDDQVKAAIADLSPDMSIEDFFGVLTASVSALKDGHIAIEAGEGLSYNENRRADITTKLTAEALALDDVPQDIDAHVEDQFSQLEAAIEAHFVADSAHGNFEDPIAWATIENDGERYGYLWVSSFADVVEGSVDESVEALHDAMEQAMSDWGEVSGVIIDVRINHGGWDVLGRALASHFVSEKTHVYSKRTLFDGKWNENMAINVSPSDGARYSGPVAVLASNTTISAAETFVMAMRALDQVTVVGEPTYGILSDGLPKFLPSGVFFSLSNEEYSTPDGDVFELVGVPADVELEVFSLSDREAGRDGSIEAALEVLKGK